MQTVSCKIWLIQSACWHPGGNQLHCISIRSKICKYTFKWASNWTTVANRRKNKSLYTFWRHYMKDEPLKTEIYFTASFKILFVIILWRWGYIFCLITITFFFKHHSDSVALYSLPALFIYSLFISKPFFSRTTDILLQVISFKLMIWHRQTHTQKAQYVS